MTYSNDISALLFWAKKQCNCHKDSLFKVMLFINDDYDGFISEMWSLIMFLSMLVVTLD